MIISHSVVIRMRNVSVKTHILCSITFFPEIRAVYEIMEKNAVERVRPQMATNTAHALCMLGTQGYTHTLIICNAAFPHQQWMHERVSAIKYLACLADTQSVI